MDIINYEDFKRRITKDLIKHNCFGDFHSDIMSKTEECYLKVPKSEIYSKKVIYITCMMIMNKYFLDKPLDNLSFSKIYFIDLKKLRDAEFFCLENLDWKIEKLF